MNSGVWKKSCCISLFLHFYVIIVFASIHLPPLPVFLFFCIQQSTNISPISEEQPSLTCQNSAFPLDELVVTREPRATFETVVQCSLDCPESNVKQLSFTVAKDNSSGTTE